MMVDGDWLEVEWIQAVCVFFSEIWLEGLW
jgi:hypothetical protein